MINIQHLFRTSALLLCFFVSALGSIAQSTFELINEAPANEENEPAPVHPLPHDRQVRWMQTEFYAFFHYGMNTFTNSEWGNELDAPAATYAPTQAPNPRQWLEAARSAHMKGGIAVAKHHDGFCLWPTKTTDYNITHAGNDFGRNGNIPELFAQAARDLNMKYGFYVSPWDAHDYRYGTPEYVNEVFLRQCKELAEYGSDQFEMWLDGANGGIGKYGDTTLTSRSIDRTTYYDVPNIRDMVHSISPDCVLWGVGGEARWIGNERGFAGETNWCTDNRADGRDQPKAAEGNENGWMWLPGESDAKATDKGWFWHSDEAPLTAERLFQMYLETVGRNATLILNLPPDNRGLLPAATVAMMKTFGQLLTDRLGTNYAAAKGVVVNADNTRAKGATRTYKARNVVDGNVDTYYATEDGINTATVTIRLPKARTLHYVMLQEHIQLGQRVKAFNIETSADGKTWTPFGGSMPTTTIGYKRIISHSGNTTSYTGQAGVRYVRVNITDCKSCPVIENIALY